MPVPPDMPLLWYHSCGHPDQFVNIMLLYVRLRPCSPVVLDFSDSIFHAAPRDRDSVVRNLPTINIAVVGSRHSTRIRAVIIYRIARCST